jgi:hypothetical protein
MSMQRYCAVSAVLLMAILAFLALVIPRQDEPKPPAPDARAPSSQPDRRAFDLQLDSMRAMHRKMLSVTSVEARRSLLDDSAQIMSDGVSMMRRMKAGLPTTATGEPLSDVISPAEYERVRDFMLLMELLVEMKGDRDAALTLDQPPPRSTSFTTTAAGALTQEKAATSQVATG